MKVFVRFAGLECKESEHFYCRSRIKGLNTFLAYLSNMPKRYGPEQKTGAA
jgi:hypothetical protein